MQSDNINPIVKRILVQCKMHLCSPALIGSGESEYTDRDVFLDSHHHPLIPGTSLAGILRSALEDSDAQLLFGKSTNDIDDLGRTSPLWVFDAPVNDAAGNKADIIIIDNVALDEYKVAKKGGKFDFQALDRGSTFDLRLMLVIRANDLKCVSSQPAAECYKLEKVLDKLLNQLNFLYIGGKTSRGFGKLKCSSVSKAILNTDSFDDLQKWLDFNWSIFDWSACEIPVVRSKPAHIDTMCAKLNLDGTLLIRDDYSVEGDEDTAHITSAGIPVIYGTSWAGAIRNGLSRLLKANGFDCESYLDEVFGCDKWDDISAKRKTTPSKIRVDASYFGNNPKTSDKRHAVTRVKIDRWTGGAAESALFTTKPQFGGSVALTIQYPCGDKAIHELLVLALEAINLGIITIGGETSVGRGKFVVVDINGEKDIETLFAADKENLVKCMPRKEEFCNV